MDMQALNQIDPLKKQPEHGVGGVDLSPMDPPEAYAPPAMDRVLPEDMHPFLKRFSDEHVLFMEELKRFEAAILSVQKTGYTKELDTELRHFFHFFDLDFAPHSRREEVFLFPLLNRRLIATGEHSPLESSETLPKTAIDIMEDDHFKAIQLAAVVLNFMGLAFRLPDERSKLLVLDAALEQGKELVELLRLHIFREDNLVFSSAHRLISHAEFDHIQSQLEVPL